MKRQDYIKELNAKDEAALREELLLAKKELFNLRFQHATNQLDNTARITEVRKNIARINTAITMKANAQKASRRKGNTVERNLRKVRVGKVTSDKMDKTIVVSIEHHEKHPLYKKIVKRTYKLKAHDENNECHVGDTVRVMETKPISKDKRWRLVSIVERAK